MAVYTQVTEAEVKDWLICNYPFEFKDISLEPISAGSVNSNYYLNLDQAKYILTIYEQPRQQIQQVLKLMNFIATDLACPEVYPNIQNEFLTSLQQKPAACIEYISGTSISQPDLTQAKQIGSWLATLHTLTMDYQGCLYNNKDKTWQSNALLRLTDYLTGTERDIIDKALQIVNDSDIDALPTSIIHSDLFRDNSLFNYQYLSGVIDLFYAYKDICIYDLAVTLNDWCHLSGANNPNELQQAIIDGYQEVRVLSQQEQELLTAMQLRAALRFWLSRLELQYFPPEGPIPASLDPKPLAKLIEKLMP